MVGYARGEQGHAEHALINRSVQVTGVMLCRIRSLSGKGELTSTEIQVTSYRWSVIGGGGVLVSNSDVGARLKYFCGREERTVSKAKAGSEGPEEQVRHVVWRVSWSKDWDNFDLPGTGRNIKDILRDFFLAYESGKPTELVFGH